MAEAQERWHLLHPRLHHRGGQLPPYRPTTLPPSPVSLRPRPAPSTPLLFPRGWVFLPGWWGLGEEGALSVFWSPTGGGSPWPAPSLCGGLYLGSQSREVWGGVGRCREVEGGIGRPRGVTPGPHQSCGNTRAQSTVVGHRPLMFGRGYTQHECAVWSVPLPDRAFQAPFRRGKGGGSWLLPDPLSLRPHLLLADVAKRTFRERR